MSIVRRERRCRARLLLWARAHFGHDLGGDVNHSARARGRHHAHAEAKVEVLLVCVRPIWWRLSFVLATNPLLRRPPARLASEGSYKNGEGGQMGTVQVGSHLGWALSARPVLGWCECEPRAQLVRLVWRRRVSCGWLGLAPLGFRLNGVRWGWMLLSRSSM